MQPRTILPERGLYAPAPRSPAPARVSPYALGLSTAHISPRPDQIPDEINGSPHVTLPKNGNLTLLKIGTSHKSRCGGGGLRSEITEFSRASRRRMQQLLNSVDQARALVPVLITLTYHNDWPEDPARWKDHLDAFRKRLERRYGKFSAIWRLEYQRRGAPHFHLLCFFWSHQGRPGLLPFLQDDVGPLWWEVTGRTSEEHLQAGTRCELPRSWKGANVYLSKYMTKLEKLIPGSKPPGRFWGVWRKDLLPILYETFVLPFSAAIRFRRAARRYASMKARRWDLGSFSCFVSYSSALKLLGWLVGPDPPGPGRRRLPPRTNDAGRVARIDERSEEDAPPGPRKADAEGASATGAGDSGPTNLLAAWGG